MNFSRTRLQNNVVFYPYPSLFRQDSISYLLISKHSHASAWKAACARLTILSVKSSGVNNFREELTVIQRTDDFLNFFIFVRRIDLLYNCTILLPLGFDHSQSCESCRQQTPLWIHCHWSTIHGERLADVEDHVAPLQANRRNGHERSSETIVIPT